MFYETVNTKEDDVDNNVEREESTVCDVHTTTIVDECVLTLTQRDDAEWCPASCRFRWWGCG